MKSTYDPFVPIKDNRSPGREKFLKKWFNNNLDVLRFLYFLGEQTRIPVLGSLFIKPIIQMYYDNIHPGSFIIPRKDIEAIVNSSSYLAIDPCICRIFNQNCDAPIYTCLRINFAAEIRERETERGLTKEEALEIVRNARKHELIFSLEHCFRPYSYNICMCCTCCCVPKQFRSRFGLDVYLPGPYVPHFDEEKCILCEQCIHRCPMHAILGGHGNHHINIEACLGCGVCADNCPNGAIEMVNQRKVKRNDLEPSWINLYLKRIFLELVMTPLVLLFKLLKGSQQYKVESIEPRKKDVTDVIFQNRLRRT